MHRVSVSIPIDHPAFAGHFPGRPLLPGVALLAEVLEAALDLPDLAARIGPAPRLAVVKFLAPVAPGAELVIQFELAAGRIGFEVRAAHEFSEVQNDAPAQRRGSSGAALVASGQFEPAGAGA
jgi:3-hydroxyacyl-[acyl-carrier-protein] dehydratase